MAIQNWIGEGIDPTTKESPDIDILREILELLWNSIELGLFTLFVKIKIHETNGLGRLYLKGTRLVYWG